MDDLTSIPPGVPRNGMEPVTSGAVAGRPPVAARLAVLGIFFLNGLALASWVVRIPAVQEKLDLSEGLLGIALLGTVSASIASWLIQRVSEIESDEADTQRRLEELTA